LPVLEKKKREYNADIASNKTSTGKKGHGTTTFWKPEL
jgi:hypothetical protein